MNHPAMRVTDLSLVYPRATATALDGVTCDVRQGESVAVVGASGSGKTSLLLCLAGIEVPTRGSVAHGGLNLTAASPEQRAAWRLRHAGFVFQAHNLVPELSLRDNIALPLELLRRKRIGEAVRAMVSKLGLDEAAHRKPSEVSGGQAQRAAVARALVHGPSVVFADEPTGALDTENRDVVLDLLRRESEDVGATLVMVTHDIGSTWPGMRRLTLSDGRLVADEVVG